MLWHLAGAVFLFRWIFRDPKVDVRFLSAGALLPDLIDLPLGTLVLVDRYSTGELWAHSLLVPSLAAAGVLVVTRRGRRRRAWMALVSGWLFHLLLDGMWTSGEVFLWPFFGDFPAGPRPYWSGLGGRLLSNPWLWVKELIGLLYLVGLWLRLGLSDPRVRGELFRTGRLPSPTWNSTSP